MRPDEVVELADACANLWATALGVYYSDARSAWRGIQNGGDGGEALNDLMGHRVLLRNLCRQIGADPQRMGDAMLDALEQGMRFNSARMTKKVA